MAIQTVYSVELDIPDDLINSFDPFDEGPDEHYVGLPEKTSGENTMNVAVNTGFDRTAQQLAYLCEELDKVSNQINNKLRNKYGLTDDTPPATPKELADRLAKGLYTIRNLDTKPNIRFNPWGSEQGAYIRWRDPNKKEDQVGYDTAWEKLEAAETVVEETIALGTIEEARAALTEFRKFDA